MKKITLLLIFMYSLVGYCQFPEGFEGTPDATTGLPTDWNQYQNTAGLSSFWKISSVVTTPPAICAGNNAIFIDRDTNVSVGSKSEYYLVTPQFTVPANGQFRFTSRQGQDGDQLTTYKIKISTSTDPSLLKTYTAVPKSTTANDTTWTEIQMNAAYNACQDHTVDLSLYKGQKVYLAIVRDFNCTDHGLFGDKIWIDNVNVVSKCLTPTKTLAPTVVAATTATIDWSDSVATQWDIELVDQGATPTGVPNLPTATAHPYNLTNLTPLHSYSFYVRAVCGPGNTSDWAGPFNFKTYASGTTCAGPIVVPSLPYQTSDSTGSYLDLIDGPQNSSTLCGANPQNTDYLGGNDVFYNYTADADGLISIKMTPTAIYSSVFVYGSCPTTGPCLAGMADPNSTQRVINNFAVKQGQSYTIVLSSSTVSQTYGYTLLIQKETDCAPPIGNIPTGTDLATTYANLSWTGPTDAASWQVVVSPLGTPVPVDASQAQTATTNTGFHVTQSSPGTNLVSGTPYQYYVRALCSSGRYSSWAGPYAFNTLICPADPAYSCQYTFKMTDSGQYGWNGATMQVRNKNGVVVQTLGVGYNSTAVNQNVSVSLCNGVDYELFWDTPGQQPKGCGISVVNDQGQTIYTMAPTTPALTGHLTNWIVNCGVVDCSVVPINLSAPSATLTPHGATLSWSSPAITSWDVYVVAKGLAAPTTQTPPTYSNVTSNPFVIPTVVSTDPKYLYADTDYTFYVRAHCATGPIASSAWSVGSDFHTTATCPKPTALTVPLATITTTTAVVNWTSGTAGDNSWEILFVAGVPSNNYAAPAAPTPNPTLASGDFLQAVNSATSTYTMTGLAPSTIYYTYVRTLCSGGTDKSTWTGLTQFNTVGCNSGACQYTVVLTDTNTAGKGWNGGRMQIRQNGVVVQGNSFGATITTQGPAYVPVNVCPGIPFDLYWNLAGDTPQQIGVQIINPFNDIVYTKLPGGPEVPGTSLVTLPGNCTAPTCPKPTFPQGFVAVTNITGTTADLAWKENGGATKWEVYVVLTGSAPPKNGDPIYAVGTPNYYEVDTNPYTTINGLVGSTTYDFYVRSKCSGTDISTWTILSPQTFTTKPTNDECSTALPVIANGGTDCTQSTPGNTKGATRSIPLPDACQGIADDDVWYTFVAKSSTHIISLTNIVTSDPLAGIQLFHTVYSGGDCGTMTRLYCSANQTSVANGLIPGNTYEIRVYTAGSIPTQTATFNVCITTPPPVVNDECAAAIGLTVNTDLTCQVQTAGTVTGATASLPTSTCVGTADDDVWYKFIPTSPIEYITLNQVVGSTTDLNHAVYSGNCGSLVLKYCSDVNSLSSHANDFVVGQTYYIRVWSNSAVSQSVYYNICIGSVLPPITTNTTQYNKQQLIEDVLLGTTCANVTNITSSTGSDFFSVNGIGYFNKSLSNFPFKDGIILTSGNALNAPGPNLTTLSEGATSWPGDKQLETIISADTGTKMVSLNATILEFDFVPLTDKVSFNFLFASEEYGTFQCNFSDSFAFLLTDKTNGNTNNLAVLPIPGPEETPISVITIRDQKYNGSCDSQNMEYFGQFYGQNNQGPNLGLDPLGDPTNYNGLAIPMTASSPVTRGHQYHIKMVIADRADTAYDSAVFLEGGSFNVGRVDLGTDLLVATKTALCLGDTFTVNSGLSTDAYTISWLKDGVVIPNETGSSLVVSAQGTYTVQANYIGSTCNVTDSIVIEYYPDIVAPVPTDSLICDPSAASIFDLTKDSVIMLAPYANDGKHLVSFFTSLDDANNDVNVIANPAAFQNTDNPQKIYARVDNTDTGCHQIVTFNVSQSKTAVTIGFQAGCSGTNYIVSAVPQNASFDAGTSTYEWKEANGTDVISTKSSIVIKKAGTYTVKVTAPSGCSAEKDFTADDINCTIPKGISPDGDGKNDSLDLSSSNVKRLEVFNRYGTEVYSMDNYKDEWHGQSNSGDTLPDATYFYVIHDQDNTTVQVGFIFKENYKALSKITMKAMKKIYLALIVLVGIIEAKAQQSPHYTQYMYNMNVVNPAYAGSKDHLSFGVLYRNQWVGIDGAPQTFSLSGSAPVGKNVGAGLSIISDQVGPVKEQDVYGDFSYTLNLGDDRRLALGLKAGMTIQSIGLFSDINSSLPQPSDPSFQQNTNNSFFNIGSGAFYYTNKYYVAFSVPNMIKATYLDQNGAKYGTQVPHYFLTGGYVFDINPNVKFKPFTMIKSAFGAPVSVDLNTNFLFNNVFEAGLSYRVGSNVGAMVNYAINPQLRVGYAYDYTTSALNAQTSSSHEIIVLFDLYTPKKVSHSPRYF